jgi:hypothetical protein
MAAEDMGRQTSPVLILELGALAASPQLRSPTGLHSHKQSGLTVAVVLRPSLWVPLCFEIKHFDV